MTARDVMTPDHIRASTSLMPAFPPVEVDGRRLGDAGIFANPALGVVSGELTNERLLAVVSPFDEDEHDDPWRRPRSHG